MIVGNGKYRFELVEGWGQGPEGRPFGGVLPSVSADSDDNVFIVRRAPPAILVYDRQGRYLRTFGEDVLTCPHSVWVSGEEVFVADTKDHTVRLFNTNGKLLRTWGTVGQVGADGEPFNRPTWAVRSEAGDIFMTDGYGQSRVHHYSAEGDFLHSWGEKGPGPGQFGVPHCVRVDSRGRVLVLDREPNHRLQIFDTQGNFQEQWTDFVGPNDIYIDQHDIVYIAEGGYRVSVWNLDGEMLDRWGEEGNAPGQFVNAPHGIWVDSRGDLYVVEVPYIDNRIQKFERV
jgi:DNA-binding beta-propeller fold protein YncE